MDVVVKISVEEKTGKIQVLKIWAVADVGLAI
jgi:CO/xanthine dehydrogenase Mo-binding subunit